MTQDPVDDPALHPAPDPAPEPEPEPLEPSPERVRTGAARVDEVIRAVEELEERPIEEHVGVFESAQVQLRRALDEPADDEPADDLPTHDQHGGAEHPDDHAGSA